MSVHRENLLRAFVFRELLSSVGQYSERPHSGDGNVLLPYKRISVTE